MVLVRALVSLLSIALLLVELTTLHPIWELIMLGVVGLVWATQPWLELTFLEERHRVDSRDELRVLRDRKR